MSARLQRNAAVVAFFTLLLLACVACQRNGLGGYKNPFFQGSPTGSITVHNDNGTKEKITVGR